MIFFNRCGCVGTPGPPNPPDDPCPPECLSAPYIYYTCDEGLNESSPPFEIDIAAVANNEDACADGVTYEILDFSTDVFDAVTVDADGVVTITVNATGTVTPGTYYSILYIIRCVGEGTRKEGKLEICFQSYT